MITEVHVRLIAGLLAIILTLVLGVAIVAGGPVATSAPSRIAFEEIPPDLLPVYMEAAFTCPGLPWQVLAAVGWTESRHAQGRANPQTGAVQPPIVGPALDGTNGTARIPDPSEPDGWAHAHGPMQFLRTTWQAWGRLAPRRPVGAVPSPDNAWDAIHSAAAYLCGTEGQLTDLDQALLRYNHSGEYVRTVLAKATEYGLGTGTVVAVPVDGLLCPVAGTVSFTVDWGAPRPGGGRHQGNALAAPSVEPLVSLEAGVVECGSGADAVPGGITLWLRGQSGTSYYYAHNARNAVRVGDTVSAGQVIAYLGNTGNARATAPHLHFQVHPGGGDPVNPYPVTSRICRSGPHS